MLTDSSAGGDSVRARHVWGPVTNVSIIGPASRTPSSSASHSRFLTVPKTVQPRKRRDTGASRSFRKTGNRRQGQIPAREFRSRARP